MIDIGLKNITNKEQKLQNSQITWTSELVKIWEFEEENGIPHTLPSPYIESAIGFRKPNLKFKLTEEEEQEFIKCANDVVYFVEKYCKTMTDEGIKNITLMPHQRRVLKDLQRNRFTVWLSPRQTGKTTTSAFFMVWYNLFNYDRNSLIVANKEATSIEILDKIYIMYKDIPFFLKSGLIVANNGTLKFDNGCRIIAQATTPNAGRSFTVHLLFADEFAFIQDNIVNAFYKSIYPTLSSSKISRMIISSTANGFNKFFEIYDGATKGKNEFYPIRVDWWEVPGRDENWKNREIANLGSETAFNQEYGNEFLNEDKLLLTFEQLRKMNRIKVKYIWKKLEAFEKHKIDYNKLIWHPGYLLNNKNENHKYVLSIDTAEGIGQDYSVINVFKLEPMSNEDIKNLQDFTDESDFFKLKQIAVFRDNKTDITNVSLILSTLIYEVLGAENCAIIFEMNRGDSLYLLEKLKEFEDYYDDSLLVNTIIFDGKKNVSRIGVTLNYDTKMKYCRDFRNYIEINKYEINEYNTVEEFNNFGILKKSYAALVGHDDLAISCINSTIFFDSTNLSELISDIYDDIDINKRNLIEERLKEEISTKTKLNNNTDYSIVKDLI